MMNSARLRLSNEAGAIRRARDQRAAECSPGRKPGDRASEHILKLANRATENLPRASIKAAFAPSGAPIIFLNHNPGLTPRATHCRRLRRLVGQLVPKKTLVRAVLILTSLLPLPFFFVAHTQTAQNVYGVVRLKVKYKPAGASRDKELPRKRFFLVKGSLDENRNLIEKIKQTTAPSRECYYRRKGASEALIRWLRENDCESVYCREVEEKYLSGAEAVPEFQTAFEQGTRELKNRELARRWLTNYLPAEIRSGFYDEKQKLVQALISEAEAGTKTSVMSVMTDRKGTAYLTNIEPGTYTISNLIASETEKANILWVCEREVKATDLGTAMKRPFTLSNERDPKVKCEIVERPLPVCGQP
jgi:hypothetical protein